MSEVRVNTNDLQPHEAAVRNLASALLVSARDINPRTTSEESSVLQIAKARLDKPEGVIPSSLRFVDEDLCTTADLILNADKAEILAEILDYSTLRRIKLLKNMAGKLSLMNEGQLIRHGEHTRIVGSLSENLAALAISRHRDPSFLPAFALEYQDKSVDYAYRNFDIIAATTSRYYKIQVKSACFGDCAVTGKARKVRQVKRRKTQEKYLPSTALLSACCNLGVVTRKIEPEHVDALGAEQDLVGDKPHVLFFELLENDCLWKGEFVTSS